MSKPMIPVLLAEPTEDGLARLVPVLPQVPHAQPGARAPRGALPQDGRVPRRVLLVESSKADKVKLWRHP